MCRSSTLRSDGTGIRAFVRRAGLFLLPLLVAGGLFEADLWRQGEWRSIRGHLARDAAQADAPVLQRRYFSQQFNLYHLEMLKRRAPQIVAIGSSRVGSLRSRMLHPLHAETYVAQNFLRCAEDLAAYADLLATGECPRPRAVIVGLDPWWLKKADAIGAWLQPEIRDDVYSVPAHVEAFRRWIREAFREQEPPPDPGVDHYAVLRGGEQWTDPIQPFHFTEYVDRETPPVIQRLQAGTHQFADFAEIDAGKWATVLAALERLRGWGIEVVVIQPPFSTEVFRFLEGHPERFPWWRTYREEVPAQLAARGIPCAPASMPGDYGLDDARHMYDGFHAGPYFMSWVLEDLLAKCPPGGVLAEVSREHLRGLRQPPAP